MFTAANDTAKNPKILDVKNTIGISKPAIIAPTIITDEIALVTDIKGVEAMGYTPTT